MKILITGSTGFIGHHLVNHFIKEGHEVYGTYRSKMHNEVKECTYIHIDLSEKDIPTEHFDCIFHAAGQVENGTTWDYVKNSIISTKRLIDCCENNRTEKLVLFSSIAVYGEITGIVDENTVGTNLNQYAQCKLICENLLKESHIVKKYIVRLSRILGEGGFESGGFLSRFAEQMVEDKNVVYSNGDILYNLSFTNFISDIAPTLKTRDFWI